MATIGVSVATRHVTIAMRLPPIFSACLGGRRCDPPRHGGPGQAAPRESLFDRIVDARWKARARVAEASGQPSGPGQADPHAGRRQPRHRWAPQERFLVSTGQDWHIDTIAQNHAAYRRIPQSNRFGYREIQERGDALSSLTHRSRLDVAAHGTPTHVTVPGRASCFAVGPERLAQDLHRAGLRDVGVLKLRSCDTGLPGGRMSFLERMRDEFERLGVRVGFISGPTGLIVDKRSTTTIRGTEVPVYGDSKWFTSWKMRRHPVGVLTSDGQWLSQQEGMRTIRGTDTRMRFPGTRYV